MKTVLIYSGGLDSTVALYKLKREGPLMTVSFDYGQRHSKELQAAQSISRRVYIPHYIINLAGWGHLLGSSSQTNPMLNVPKGHYTDESQKQTVVPNRNMVMLALAAGLAIDREFDAVAYAAHATDRTIYPDCRVEFIGAMQTALELCHYSPIKLVAPFASIEKSAVVKFGAALDVPFNLTWSCYEGGPLHCGRCGTCVERREAFTLAGVEDPTEYAA